MHVKYTRVIFFLKTYIMNNGTIPYLHIIAVSHLGPVEAKYHPASTQNKLKFILLTLRMSGINLSIYRHVKYTRMIFFL